MMTPEPTQHVAFDLPACTIIGTATGTGRYVLPPTYSHSHYGHVVLLIAPYTGSDESRRIWAVDENSIPDDFREAVWEGIESVATNFELEVGPLVDIQVTIIGGSHHEVDSDALGFHKAAALAFRDALSKVTIVPVSERETTEGTS